MTAIQYISQLGAAGSVATTDLIPVTQGSTGPGTGTTRKVTMAQAFGAPVPIGNTTPNTGKFTTLEVANSSSTVRSFTAQVTKTLSGSAPGAVFRWGGTVAGTLDASLTGYYTTAMDSDTLDFSSLANGMTLSYIGHNLATGWSGGRTTHQTIMDINGEGTAGAGVGAGTNAYHVCEAAWINGNAQMAGTTGAQAGNLFARVDSARANPGAGYHLNGIFGHEVDITCLAGTEAGYKGAHKTVLFINDAVRGLFSDYAYGITQTASAPLSPGWRTGFALNTYEGWWPFRNSSQIMALNRTASAIAPGSPPYESGGGIDFTGITFSESSFKATGYKVDGSGNLGALTASGVALQTRSAVVARTAIVNTITVQEGGLFAGDSVTLTLTAPTTSGTTATATVATYAMANVLSIGARGTGYNEGDTFTVSGGTFGVQAVGVVTVTNAGAVFGVKLTTVGSYSVLPAFPAATVATSGVGVGMTLSPLLSILTVTVSGAGTNYSEWLPPTITSAGAGTGASTFRQAVFKGNMTGTQAPLLLNAGSSTQVDSLTVNASGPTLRSGTGAASGTQPKGSQWWRTDGGVGTTLYVSQGGGTWNAVAGV